MDRIAIFAALQWECRAVLRPLRQVRRGRLGAHTCWRSGADREVWVIKTGVGMQRAAAAAAALPEAERFALLVSTGCAGALTEDLHPGDLVVATAIVHGGTMRPTDAGPRVAALAAASAARLPAVAGPLLCSDAMLVDAEAKRAAAAAGAIAVEMEGAAIAALAGRAGVPFLAVRAVLDGVADRLPPLGPLLDAAAGRVRPLALAGHLARRPAALADVLRLQRMLGAARTGLERFHARWLGVDRAPSGEPIVPR